MTHVVTAPMPVIEVCGGRLELYRLPAATDNLVWVLVDRANCAALVVDGPDAETLVPFLEAQGLKLTHLLNTHTHPDHIGINNDLKRRGMLDGVQVVGCRSTSAFVPGITTFVGEGDEVVFGGVTGRVMRTDGHIDGHICFLFGDVLFCGDTLFTGGCGYLFDGPPQAMFDSLMRLAGLPGETLVCCAHEYTEDNLHFAWHVEPSNEALQARIRRVWEVRGAGGCTVPSRLEEERATNPFLRPGSIELVKRVRVGMPEADLTTWAGVFAATRALKDRRDHRKVPVEQMLQAFAD